jgi:maltose O-acetyltransferase
LLREYNTVDPEDEEARERLATALVGRVGPGSWIEPPFHCDYGWNIFLGDDVFVNFNCVVLDGAQIRIGERTQIGPGVHLSAATHPLDPAPRGAGVESAEPIEIGRNVWLSSAVTVGPGVTIGDDSVIGAGSVVLRDVPAGVLAVGTPARVVREL